MRFVSVVVAAFLPYQGVSMNDLPQVRDPQGFLAHLRDYLGDIHAALPRIKSKRGDRPVAMVMTGPDGTVRIEVKVALGFH